MHQIGLSQVLYFRPLVHQPVVAHPDLIIVPLTYDYPFVAYWDFLADSPNTHTEYANRFRALASISIHTIVAHSQLILEFE